MFKLVKIKRVLAVSLLVYVGLVAPKMVFASKIVDLRGQTGIPEKYIRALVNKKESFILIFSQNNQRIRAKSLAQHYARNYHISDRCNVRSEGKKVLRVTF